MKINWGTGIVIGMLAFISFIMYFVVTMMSSSDYDHDLVVEDYYKAELHYQQDIDAQENALALHEQISLERRGDSLIVLFPEGIDLEKTTGMVSLYRPSNKNLDFSIPFSEIKSSEFEIPADQLVNGRWNVKVTWQNSEKEFMFKTEIVY
ncbi:FixH family protein [uncultured Christiangramia sp.]|uniref:FixH family protein n=1 Tax=uncultured Christiangramia sp. TaxID=503836 RepID=UPI002634B1C6|nr:FixH family protein [uncultured Christiangramia sp.]|tara:strand:- start:958 stop:1407 length:450 start_codon:yes stop_codon:yes gene_type:complete